MMRKLAGWVMVGLVFFTTACSPAGVPARTAAPPSPTPPGTATPPPATVTATIMATPTATPQPAPFDPLDCAARACTRDDAFWLRRPVAAPAQQTADNSYLYGSTQNGSRIPHTGVEFYNASGTPVLAAADGSVAYAGNDESAFFAPWNHFYGNLIVLEHQSPRGETLYTLYAHLSQIDVQPGETVRAGQTIGRVGMSGGAIGSHLHFEVRAAAAEYTTTRNPFLQLFPLHAPDNTPLAALAGRLTDRDGRFITTPQLVIERMDLPENAAPQRFFLETYAPDIPSDPGWQENFVLADLEPGEYRISFVYYGRLVERFVTLYAGQLTYLSLQLEN
jgi:murein DD-endopeptidase MepM/ murein hydrolase activator NlpD